MNTLKNNMKFIKNISVLYVEDHEDIRKEIVSTLENKVKKLFVASDGEEGLLLYKKHKPDVIITDINMPKMTGIEMAKEIRELNDEVSIIVISAYNDSSFLSQAIDFGVNNFLVKPLDLIKLFKNLGKVAKTITLEKENTQMKLVLEEYKSIVDEKEIVGKMDKKGRFIYVNKPFLHTTSYKEEQVIGKRASFLLCKKEKRTLIKAISSALQTKNKIWRGKIKSFDKSGEEFYTDTIIKAIMNDKNEVKEYMCMSHNITTIESTKNYLKRQNLKNTTNLREALLHLEQYEIGINESNIVSRTNTKGIITYVNEKFVNISKYSHSELLGHNHNIIRHIDTSMNTINTMWKTIQAGEIWKGRLKNKDKHNETYVVDAVIIPIFDNKNNIIEYLGIMHDITPIIKLHEEFEETQREIIYRMGEIGETRSKETGNHVKRVAQYSRLLAKLYGLDQKNIDILFMASPMHDIGKVGIPDNILNKKGKLSPDEWEIMKTHSEIGYSILKNSSRDLLQAASIVSYMHHEKWDGSGYPQGLEKEEIHIFGRITALADVFDALGSDRCYKAAWDLEDILELFKKERGKQFEPKLIDLFFENIEEFLFIRDKYID